jgi:hypothetical protein
MTTPPVPEDEELGTQIKEIIGIQVNVAGRSDLGLEPYSTYAADSRQVDALLALIHRRETEARKNTVSVCVGELELYGLGLNTKQIRALNKLYDKYASQLPTEQEKG